MIVYFKKTRASSLWSFLYNTRTVYHSGPTIGVPRNPPIIGLHLYNREYREIKFDNCNTLTIAFDTRALFSQSGDFWESMSILCGGNDNTDTETRGIYGIIIESYDEVNWMLELNDSDSFFIDLDMLYLRDHILLDFQVNWTDAPNWVFNPE